MLWLHHLLLDTHPIDDFVTYTLFLQKAFNCVILELVALSTVLTVIAIHHEFFVNISIFEIINILHQIELS